MAHILGAIRGPWEELQPRFEAYWRYLDSVRPHLPPAAYAFATADWHYAFSDPRCPHDAGVETVTISEPSSGERHENRRIDIHVRLLGAYHDGHIELRHRNVASYAWERPPPRSEPAHKAGHGDWRDDEVRLSERGLVLHEVVFVGGSHWLIECDDIEHEWRPFADDGETPPDSPDTPQ